MIEPQAWPPLCGAVAGCGALLAVAGMAKLVRTVRGTGGGTAVQKVLGLGDAPWRMVQAGAGVAELVVGLFVCGGVRPSFADALMAGQGVLFTVLLSYLIHKRVPGDCGCVARRRPTTPERQAVTPWALARAVVIALAGITGSVVGVQPPSTLPRPGEALAWAVALVVLALLVAVDLELNTPRCHRPLLFPTRTTLAEVTDHDIYRAMAASLGARADRVLFRRAGCIDEFWFPARSEPDDRPYLTIKAGRTPSGALMLRAAVAETAPHGEVGHERMVSRARWSTSPVQEPERAWKAR